MCSTTEAVVLDLPGSVEAPARARDLVESHLCREHGRAALAAAQLLVSELVTSAVLYGEGPVTLRLECGVTELTMCVSHRTRSSSSGEVPLDEAGGLRSALLGKLSRSWGEQQDEGGRTLWSSLPTGAMPERPVPAQRTRLTLVRPVGPPVTARRRSAP